MKESGERRSKKWPKLRSQTGVVGKRREESAELRALLASRFERHTLATLSPRPDSGHWSSTHSDDDASLSDLDEELCLERQCRQLKAHIEILTRAITERNQEIERLENRLNESVPFMAWGLMESN
ncbi:unnamed protein product [Toxocara canis]|uniref:Coiled-coil domain-containing protein 52 n=1 Tax=Toxocara canis TaxID=6265 RepID=A0A183VGV8_TOXCA|nr:unnamed protein product [Toxocara canis]